MAAVESFGPDRTDIEPRSFKKYAPKDGNTDRIGIICEDRSTMFKGVLTHFKDRYFVCKSTKEKKEICCLHTYENNEPRYRVGGAVIQYSTKMVDGKEKVTGYEILPWIFSETVYKQLIACDKDFPLESHDVRVTGTKKGDFLNLNIVPCPNSIWSSNTDLKKKVLADAIKIRENIGKRLATDLSITEIREQLNIDAPGSQDAAADVDVTDIANTL